MNVVHVAADVEHTPCSAVPLASALAQRTLPPSSSNSDSMVFRYYGSIIPLPEVERHELRALHTAHL